MYTHYLKVEERRLKTKVIKIGPTVMELFVYSFVKHPSASQSLIWLLSNLMPFQTALCLCTWQHLAQRLFVVASFRVMGGPRFSSVSYTLTYVLRLRAHAVGRITFWLAGEGMVSSRVMAYALSGNEWLPPLCFCTDCHLVYVQLFALVLSVA